MSTDAQAPPVVVESLSKVYHPERPEIAVHALADLSFSIARGDSVAIIGPSGCGKSTLLHVLGCLDRPTSGRYLLEGRDVAHMGEDERARMRNRHIGFVFQSFNLLPRMDALENVELPLLYARVPDARAKAMHALERTGLADRMHHRPNELSGGQKQRVAIARALVTGPSLLLGDEPTGALDTRTSAEVIELLLGLNRDGATLVLVTHDPVVARVMRRALWMRDGRIVDDGPAAAIMEAVADETRGAEPARGPGC